MGRAIVSARSGKTGACRCRQGGVGEGFWQGVVFFGVFWEAVFGLKVYPIKSNSYLKAGQRVCLVTLAVKLWQIN